MTLDNFEMNLLKKAQDNIVPSPESHKAINGGRLVNICRGLAQKAFAYPNPEKSPNTLKLANDDNDLIDRNTKLINTYESYIQNGDTSRTGSVFSPNNLIDTFAENIAVKQAEITEVKTTNLTSKQITDKDRFKIKITLGGGLKL